jgi:hypothetical protein
MKKAIVVASLFLAVAVVSCDKDDDDDNMTTAQIIASTTWNIDTIAFDMDKNGSIDAPVPGLETCELDNTFTFSADSTGVFDEGATKCDAADPQNTPFEWQLSSDEKKMTIAGDFSGELDQVNGDVDILAVSRDSLVLSKLITLTFPVQFSGNLILKLKK